jgi:putative membrane protein
VGYAALARGRADWTPARSAWFLSGVIVLWLALETPLDVVSDEQLQSLHMFQHVLLAVIAPPMLLLGLSPAMAAVLAGVPGVRAITEPVPAQLAAALAMIGWHIPTLYNITVTNDGVHILEHLTFIASGTLFWWPVLAATSAQARWQLGDLGKLAYLLVGTFPQDGVAIILQFSRELFYPWYGLPAHRVPGWDPVIDQNIAGTVLQMVGKTSYLVAAIVLFYRWVAREREEDSELLSGWR